MTNNKNLVGWTLALLLASHAAPALAVTQTIGDIDGFGFKADSSLMRATVAPHTTPADSDGDGIIEPGEFLPDLDLDGRVQVNCGDEFDNRSAAEMQAIDGAQMTDRALTPAPAAHEAMFVFTFPTPVVGDIDYGVDHFINFVFGDYDIIPGSIEVDGTVVQLTHQGGGQDGLVQKASAVVPWSAMADGQVIVKVIAPNEPYLAFDYVLLDTDQIADNDGDGIPDNVDNCRLTANQDQADRDHDNVGDACDACPDDAANDLDEDGLCGNVDNCPGVSNADQADVDGDGVGDACDGCSDPDHDGICSGVDQCEGTVFPEAAPTESLGVNRWALGANGVFVTTAPQGKGPKRSYTIQQTRGCSCEQIITALGLGAGHQKFGCSISAMDQWVATTTAPGN